MAPLDPATFAAQTGVSRETMAALESYAALLRRWAERVNLVGRNTLGDVWRRHFLDSAQLTDLVPAGSRSLVDIGSGAGFPGLVLAALGVPGVMLVEADGRKCAFLREAIRVMAVPAAIVQERAERIAPRPCDVVVSRACAPLDRLLDLAERFIGPDTRCLFLKGEHVADELEAARGGWRMRITSRPSRTDPRGVVLCLDEVSRA